MRSRTAGFAAFALLCIAAGSGPASAQSDGAGGTSGGSTTGGVGWTPTPPDGGATKGSDKGTSEPGGAAAQNPPSGDDKGASSAGKDGDVDKPGQPPASR